MRSLDTARVEGRQITKASLGFLDTVLLLKIMNLYCLPRTSRRRRWNSVTNTFCICKCIVSADVVQHRLMFSSF